MSGARQRKVVYTLDGLRGVAAICVVMFQGRFEFGLPLLFPHAYLAVDFFFALNGFVLAYAYEDRLKTTLTRSRYIWLRIVRLYPLIVLGALLGGMTLWMTHPSGVSAGKMMEYIALAALGLPLLTGTKLQGINPINPPGWSLTFEIVASIVYGRSARHMSTR